MHTDYFAKCIPNFCIPAKFFCKLTKMHTANFAHIAYRLFCKLHTTNLAYRLFCKLHTTNFAYTAHRLFCKLHTNNFAYLAHRLFCKLHTSNFAYLQPYCIPTKLHTLANTDQGGSIYHTTGGRNDAQSLTLTSLLQGGLIKRKYD